MATEAPRRSQRTRKPVKSYAEEQADEKQVSPAAPSKGKRKRKTVDEADDEASEAPKPAKKAKKKPMKKVKSVEHDDADVDAEDGAKASKKRQKSPQLAKKPTIYKTPAVDNTWHAHAAERRIATNKKKIKTLAPGQKETRLRSYVDEPAQSYHNAMKKINKERMFVLDRERSVEENCHALHDDCPCESVQIAGSTGNVYTVIISHTPSCTCPAGIFNRKGGEKLCKHAIYVLHHVLKAPEHLKCQNALLTDELREIFSNSPALPAEVVDDEPQDGNRKPVEDDCPICCMEFEADKEIVWCRAACGNNVHKGCFDQWARTKAGNVTCPFCRTAWESKAPKTQKVSVASVSIPESRSGKGGYRNVREQLDYDD